MKYKVNKKQLEKGLKKFSTKGRLTLMTKENNLIKSAKMIAQNDTVKFIGVNDGYVIFARLILDAEVLEEGEIYVGDLASLIEYVKKMKGKEITISVDGGGINVTDGKRSMSYGIDVIPSKERVELWDKYNVYEDGVVKFRSKDVEYDYTYWFDIDDGSVLHDIVDTAQKLIRTDVIEMETVGELRIRCENEDFKRNYEDTYEITPEANVKFVVGYILPILSNISGLTQFYYKVSNKGYLRVWIHNDEIEWLVRYNVKQQ